MHLSAYRGAICHFLDDPGKSRDAMQYFEDGVLMVQDGRIVDVMAWGDEARSRLGGKEPEPVNGVIVPGFIDCHVHYPQIDMMAAPGHHLLEWLAQYTFPAEARFCDENVAHETAAFFLDQLQANGVTSALVMPSVHRVSVEALFEEAFARNMRIISGKVMMDTNAPPNISDTAETAYMESKDLIRGWSGRGRIGYAVTPRFALTSTPQELELAGRLLAENPDVLLHTHLAENLMEVTAVHRAFPDCADYLAVYEKFGLATEQSVFAHGVHVNASEWGRIAGAGSSVIYCPSSNLYLGSGLFDLPAAQKFGVRVGLGSDIGAGTSLSPFATISDAYKVCQIRHRYADPARLFYMATLGAARAIRMDEHVGNFAPGKEADFLVLDAEKLPILARRLRFTQSVSDKVMAMAILGDDRAVSRTYIAGRLNYIRP